jgi:hypothetical protein
MNTTVAIVMIVTAGVGGLVMTVGWIIRQCSGLLPVAVFGSLAALGAGWMVVELFSGVLSWHGLAYSFGLAEAGDLTWPGAVRVTTLALALELVTLGVWAADYYTNRGPNRPLHGWLWAHVSGPARVIWHGVVAPVMVLRDLAYQRSRGWPRRPAHRIELARVLGALVYDGLHSAAALGSAVRRAEWRKLRRVSRTRPVPKTTRGLVVDGEATAGAILRTWPVLDSAPATVDAGEGVHA